MLVPFAVAIGLIAIGLLLDRVAAVRVVIPRYFHPYRLINVVLLLRRPRHHAARFDSLLLLKDLDEPEVRAEVLRRICAEIAVEDVVDGFYEIGGESWAPKRLWRAAGRLFKEQTELAGVEARKVREVSVAPAEDEPDRGCLLLGIAVAVQNPGDYPTCPRLHDELIAMLRALPDGGVGDRSSLAMWYVPRQGEAMSEDEGRERFGAVLASTM